MSCREEITKYMTELLHSMPAGQKNCSDEDIGELFGVYARLLGHLEAFFSILHKKRFNLNDSNVDKAMLHCDKIENLWRYLKMNVTPKFHLLFVHLLIFLEQVQGFGDLGEDAYEWAYQEWARNDSRVGLVVNISGRERTKSQFEAIKKSAKVKEMMSELKQKSKRKFNIDGPRLSEENGTERKRLGEERRDELILSPLFDGTRILMSDIKRQKILNEC